MKVPLHPVDIENNVVTELARFVMTEVGSQSKLGLSKCQELIVKVLGYKDLHDAQKSVSNVIISDETPDALQLNEIAKSLISAELSIDTTDIKIPFELLYCFSGYGDAVKLQVRNRFLEVAFCEKFFGFYSGEEYVDGELFQFINKFVDLESIDLIDYELSVMEVFEQYGDMPIEHIIKEYTKISVNCYKAAINDYLKISPSMRNQPSALESIMSKNTDPVLGQSFGSLYLDSPGSWDSMSFNLDGAQKDYHWIHSEIRDDLKYVLKIFKFDEPGYSGIKAYTWSCAVYEEDSFAAHRNGIKSIVSGSIYIPKKNTFTSEACLVGTADMDSDESAALMIEICSQIKKQRDEELDEGFIIHHENAYYSDETYLNHLVQGSTIMIVDQYVSKDIPDAHWIADGIYSAARFFKKRFKHFNRIYVNKDAHCNIDVGAIKAPDHLIEYNSERTSRIYDILQDDFEIDSVAINVDVIGLSSANLEFNGIIQLAPYLSES